MTSSVLVHAVRDYGGLTEPFIRQRLAAKVAGVRAELWYEQTRGAPEIASRRVNTPWIRAGSAGDRLFLRFPWLGPPAAGQYREAESESRPALIHAHYAPTGYLVGSVTSAPLIVSVYGYDVTVLPRRRGWPGALRALARRASLVVVEGPFMERVVEGLGFSADQIALVPIAAGLDAVGYRSPETATDRPLRLITCGRFVEKKGLDHAILAWSSTRKRLPASSTLTIVGDGPLRSELQALARRLDLGDTVAFSGALQRRDYLERLSTADLLIAASRHASNGDGEGGAPTTILDAQAAGVVVIGSRHADIPFLVEDRVTGYLVDEGSIESLSRGIEAAVEDRERWPQVSSAARAQIDKRHSDAAVTAALSGVYAQVLGL